MTSRGLHHSCSPGVVQALRRGQEDRACSLVRSTASRWKRNLSLLVGREEEDVKKNIFSYALSRIAMKKGENLRLKQMEGGVVSGQGKEVTVGAAPSLTP